MDSQAFPLLSPFNYYQWKSNMCAYLKRQCLYDVSIGAMREPESCQEKCDWLNDNDTAYGTMCLAIPPTMRYRFYFVDYPFELWRNLDEALWIQEEHVSYMESKQMGTSLCVLPPNILASCISQEVVWNEEEEVDKDSTNDPTQFCSSVCSSIFQEAIFHEYSIRVVSITIVE